MKLINYSQRFCITLLAIIVFQFGCTGQESLPSKKALKKKYEHLDSKSETKKNFTMSYAFPDSIVLNPLHYVNTYVVIDTGEFVFSSIAIDVHIKSNLPVDYCFYISPFNGSINRMEFYAGLISNKEGGRKGLFARWMERDKGASKTKGNSTSGDKEGDGIDVADEVQWGKGDYRLTLYTSGYVRGKAVPANFQKKDIIFAWGEYEHTWVTMDVVDLKTNKKHTIGSLAFPGKTMRYSARNIIFLEHYGTAINFARQKPTYQYSIMNYKDLPFVKVDIDNIKVNGLAIKPISVKTLHNYKPNPNQSKIKMPVPLMSHAEYDAGKVALQYEVGRIQKIHRSK